MLVSGFVDGKFIYISEFPFNSPDYVKNLETKVHSWQRKLRGSKSIKGQFLRSADFDYRDFIKSSNLKIVYLLNKRALSKYKPYMTKDFYDFLEEKAK